MTQLLVDSAIRGTFLAAAGALVLAVLRVRHAAAQHAVWKIVLVFLLLLPAWLARGPRAELRVPPAVVPGIGAAAAPAALYDAPAVPSRNPGADHRPARLPWRAALLAIYGLGAAWLLLRLTIGTMRANRLTSAECVAPITVGLWRPRVILPGGWTGWPAGKLGAILAHEQAHVRRHDPLVQWMALFYRALFWFHPLAWWLERKLARLAEEACDAAVLEQGHDAGEYAQCLLEMERAVMQAGSRVTALGVAMPGPGLPGRVAKLFESGRQARLSKWRIAAAASFCAMTGIVLGAGTIEPAPALLRLGALPALRLPSPPERFAQVQNRTPVIRPPADRAAKARIEFEAVAIRPAPRMTIQMAQAGQIHSRMDEGGVSFSTIPLLSLISMAYRTHQALISGPGWLDDQSFEIEAKPPAGATKDQIPEMLQHMLESRFGLQLHYTPRVEQVYRLTVGKQGIKFKEATGDTPPDQKGCAGRPGHSRCRSVTLAQWADGVSAQARSMASLGGFGPPDGAIDMPVVDETGLKPEYDFDLEWIPAAGVGGGRGGGIDAPGASTKANSIFEALEAVGLKLEPGKHSIDTVVIDHIEKTPTEN